MVKEIKREIVKGLLRLECFEFNLNDFYTFASGIKSPVYCDTRLTLGDPFVRGLITTAYIYTINRLSNYKNIDVIAGVATGAISQGTLIAKEIDKPFIYVRSKAKDHGKIQLIEGKKNIKDERVIVIEDTISTGESVLKVVEELRNAGAEVLGVVSLFAYGFLEAGKRFNENNIFHLSLISFSELLSTAKEENYLSPDEYQKINYWYNSLK